MNSTSAFRLLLIDDDDDNVSRITSLLGSECSIMRFRNVKSAEAWLGSDARTDLIVVGLDSAKELVKVVRNKGKYRFVSIVILFDNSHLQTPKSIFSTGITDMIDVDEESEAIHSKLKYYMELSTHFRSVEQTNKRVAPYTFTLPWWKRGIDIAVSLCALILLLPLLLVVAALIMLDSKGPIFYRSPRAGTHFHIFGMLKFRTMRVRADQQLKDLAAHNIYAKDSKDLVAEGEVTGDAIFLCAACREKGVVCQRPLFDEYQPVCEKLYLRENEEAAKFMKFRNDPRITRLGKFLRNSSIDELPQLLNILLGDMSLVGNRPLPLYEAEKLTTNEFAERFTGPAGLTGLWQVQKRAKGQGPMSDKERTELDITYARTFSFQTDLYIIWKTLFSLWQKENV